MFKGSSLLVFAAQAALAYDQNYHIGQFLIQFEEDECALQVWRENTEAPSRTLIFESDKNVVQVGFGDLDENIMKAGNVLHFPQPQETFGSGAQNCKIDDSQFHTVSMNGMINETVPFEVKFEYESENRINFSASVQGEVDGSNYMAFEYFSAPNEEIYGMGLQYSVWNFKGHKVPIISDEAGVGRGLQPITEYENKVSGGQGGLAETSYVAANSYITNNHRGFVYDPYNIGIADFSNHTRSKMVYWNANEISGKLLYASTPLDLASEVSKTVGMMKPLPSWAQQGALIGIVQKDETQGGQQFVMDQYNHMKELGLPMAGIWMQDWVGQHAFPEGTRLIWNWQLSLQHYPKWDEMVDSWAEDGVKPLIYINPYFANLNTAQFADIEIRHDYFTEGAYNGYFVKNQVGRPYMVDSISIQFAMVDFTNPEARVWIKNIIKDNLVKEGRAGGWMHDFGEYMPFDAVLYDGSDPFVYHNKYADEWQKVCQEALDEIEGGQEIVWWSRSGTTQTPGHARLMWMGDQLTTYDKFDGMQSAMVGLMNGNISGFTMGHSDIGGYTSTIIKKFGKVWIQYTRDDTMLRRWIEMSAFSDMVMRSHPTNLPEDNRQIYDSDDNILFMKRFVEQHVALADYKQELMKQAYIYGRPIVRSLMLNYPDNHRARTEHSEFMLGDSLLMAPVFDGEATKRDVYLPEGTWVHIYTQQEYTADFRGLELMDFDAPLGSPPVFVLKGSQLDTDGTLYGWSEVSDIILQ